MDQQQNRIKDRTRRIMILVFITLLCFIPFIDKAIHIDDPLFIWAAKHIQSDPLDPYGFTINWYDIPSPMYMVAQNPPTASYYLALTASVFGWNEIALHSAFILPAILLIIGTYLLAAYFCSRPFDAALITLFTPVILLSGTTLMCDIMMLCFWVWAAFLWMKGVLEDKKPIIFIAAVLAGCAALTKYFGMSLILLLFIWTIAKKHRIESSLFMLLIPAAMLAAYQWTTSLLYGRGLLFAAAAYAEQFKNIMGESFLTKALVGAAFSGGCLFTIIFYIHRLWKKSWFLVGGMVALLTVIAIMIVTIGAFKRVSVNGPDGIRWGFVMQFTLFALAGINLLAISIADLVHKKDANALLLALWVFGTVFFAIQINWSINGRSLLPLAPVMGILVVRRMDTLSNDRSASPSLEKSGEKKREKRVIATTFKKGLGNYLPLIPAAMLAILATFADANLANNVRQDAKYIAGRYKSASNTVWFLGHWGFQYYMESYGCKPLNTRNPSIVSGDIVVQPLNNTNLEKMDDSVVFLRDRFEGRDHPWMSCMNNVAGAGFYADVWGPVPCVIGDITPERYLIFEIR